MSDRRPHHLEQAARDAEAAFLRDTYRQEQAGERRAWASLADFDQHEGRTMTTDSDEPTPCFLARDDHRSFNIIRGSLVTNPSVGALYWDTTDPSSPGLVLDLDDQDDDYLPDTPEEVRDLLAAAGYDLDRADDARIAELIEEA